MRQWMIDAFAASAFKGNQACVVEPFAAWPADAWMQSLAAENNQAETAFLLRTADPDRFGLRWFTPLLEVPLCGHATLASGHALLSEIGLASPRVRFDTLSGELSVRRAGDLYEMELPSDPPHRVEEPAGLAEALGVRPVEVWAAQYLIAVLADEHAVRDLKPNIAALGSVGSEVTQRRGNVTVTAPADADGAHDVVSRFFAPGSGIPEDPATGSAHTSLVPMFTEKLGRNPLRFHQAYPGRGADMVGELAGDRVRLRGGAVTVIESVLRGPTLPG